MHLKYKLHLLFTHILKIYISNMYFSYVNVLYISNTMIFTLNDLILCMRIKSLSPKILDKLYAYPVFQGTKAK